MLKHQHSCDTHCLYFFLDRLGLKLRQPPAGSSQLFLFFRLRLQNRSLRELLAATSNSKTWI